jgi:hypothetical protein
VVPRFFHSGSSVPRLPFHLFPPFAVTLSYCAVPLFLSPLSSQI